MNNLTSVIFLFLSIIVAVFNAILQNYQYFIFCIPFLLACLLQDKKSKIAEVFGIAIASSYTMFNNEYIGMMGLFISSLFFMFIGFDKKYNIIYLICTALVVMVSSILTFKIGASIVTHVFLDTFLYSLCCIAVYISISNFELQNKKKQNTIDQKYLNVIDELQLVAHESIDMLKQMQKEASDDRSGKNS